MQTVSIELSMPGSMKRQTCRTLRLAAALRCAHCGPWRHRQTIHRAKISILLFSKASVHGETAMVKRGFNPRPGDFILSSSDPGAPWKALSGAFPVCRRPVLVGSERAFDGVAGAPSRGREGTGWRSLACGNGLCREAAFRVGGQSVAGVWRARASRHRRGGTRSGRLRRGAV